MNDEIKMSAFNEDFNLLAVSIQDFLWRKKFWFSIFMNDFKERNTVTIFK